MLRSWNIQKVSKHHGILVGSIVCIFLQWRNCFCEHYLLLNLGCLNWSKKDTRPIYWYDWQFTLNPDSYSQFHCLLMNTEGGKACIFGCLVQVGTFDWHQILNVYYSCIYIFDSVHKFLQQSGTAEAVFASPTLQPPGVLPSCECLRHTIIHQ